MGTTPIYALPYPASTDAPDAPTQFRSLAERTETVLAPALQKSGTTAARPAAAATAPGTVYYATDTNLWWYCIKVSTTNYWAPAPGTVVGSLYHSAATQTVASDTAGVAVEFNRNDSSVWPTSWVAGTPSRFFPQVPGTYLVSGAVGFAGNTAGYRATIWKVSGGLVSGYGMYLGPHPAASNATVIPARPRTVRTTAGQYIEMWASQTSGVTLALGSTGASQPTMEIVYAGP